MKGNAKVIAQLNEALCGELTAVNQFFIHSKMCADWGYAKMAKHLYDESIEEMKHADGVIERILFLEGTPNMQKYLKIQVGADVKAQLENDLVLEVDQVKVFKKGIDIANQARDHVSRDLCEKMLADEEEHVDHLETQLRLMKEIGLKNYLMQQM